MAEQREPLKEQISFLGTDPVGNITIKAEYRVNKRERPTIRTRTEH